MDPRPIGLFDSGVGGLSVLRELQRLAPAEDTIYFADTAFFPYGPRPAAEVRKRSFAVVRRLVDAGVKLVVVACNTASAAALDDLRQAFDLPFVGMVPGVKPASLSSPGGRVVVLATAGTLDGSLLSRVVDEFGGGASIVTVPGTGLAELVERAETGTPFARAAVRRALEAEISAGADTVVLGCTHYHFLAGDIATEFPGVALVDTSEAVARRTVQVLDELGIAAPPRSARLVFAHRLAGRGWLSSAHRSPRLRPRDSGANSGGTAMSSDTALRTGYFERLAARSRAVDSLVCVGLDPDGARHDVGDVAAYNRRVIEATAPFAACYKPNLAFYEQWGIAGLRALEQTLASIPAGIPVIGDAKRGDISSTAAAYARALFESWGFDAVTVSPFLGRDSVEPFLAYPDRGVYLLCRTSNPGGADYQDLTLANGLRLYEHTASATPAWGANLGFVVGATAPSEMRRIRELAPGVPFLVPGVGAQGGEPEEVVAAAGGDPGTIVVSASRSIYYAGEGAGLEQAAAGAARTLRDRLNAARLGR